MSFNVYMHADDVEDEYEEVGNYTGNLGGYFRWALSEDGEPMPGDRGRSDSRDAILGKKVDGGIPALDGMLGADALPLLVRAMCRTAAAKRPFLVTFNASNGWGNWRSALGFLSDIRDVCEEYPKGTIRVSW